MRLRQGCRAAVRSFVLAFALSMGLVGCMHPHAATPPPAAPTLEGDAAHPGRTQGWVRTELYFGLGPADQPDKGISEADWRDFLDHEVTARFPAGLSVEDVYGQWLGKGKTEPSRLRSKVLIILYEGSEENRGKIEAIRAAWKQKTGHQSVLRVTEPADVSF
jgi:hypothetical protein